MGAGSPDWKSQHVVDSSNAWFQDGHLADAVATFFWIGRTTAARTRLCWFD